MIIPLVGALAGLTVRKSVRPLEVMAVVAALGEATDVSLIMAEVVRGKASRLGSALAVDSLGCIVLLTVGVVSVAAAFYSIGYLREEVRKQVIGLRRVKQYFVLFHLFVMAMFFAVCTVNPIMMWIAIEATTLATAFLISFYSKPASTEAAWKYLIINSIGLLLGFFGTLLFLTSTKGAPSGELVSWPLLLGSAAQLNPMVAKIAFIFVLCGYGTKVGLVPMHTWLPDAHSKAPSPISALLSGALLNVAMLAILRFKAVTDAAVSPWFSQDLMIFFGTISIVVAAFIMFPQKNFKRLFAYSSIEHMGIMSLGFGFGGIGTFAALLHMIYHSLAKSVLFCSAGNILLKFGSTKIVKVKGVLAALPVTGAILIAGFLAITGTPPFGTFITEFYILSAGLTEHPVIVIVVLAMLALVFIGFLRHVVAMAYSKRAEPLARGEGAYLTTVPPLALMTILIVLGFVLPAPLKSLLETAASLIR
jgi:hydrogenase-4 component F